MMGLFTRLRARRDEFAIDNAVIAADHDFAPCWQPSTGQVVAVPGSQMDDPGCAGEQAYGVDFEEPTVPGAILTAWFYPVPLPDGDYAIGRRWEYRLYRPGQEPWGDVGYDTSDDQGSYPDLEGADQGARHIAQAFASTSFTGCPERSLDGFDWDGASW